MHYQSIIILNRFLSKILFQLFPSTIDCFNKTLDEVVNGLTENEDLKRIMCRYYLMYYIKYI